MAIFENDTSIKAPSPPYSKDIEELVLGAILREDTAIHRVIDIITVETFWFPSHQYIFSAAYSLFKKNMTVDIVTVYEQLKADGKLSDDLDISFLSTLSAMVTNTTSLEQHVRFIEEKSIARKEIGIAMRKIQALYKPDKDVFETLAETDQESYEARNSINAFKNVTTKFMVDNFREFLLISREKKGLVGLTTGVPALDDLTGGFQPKHLITIGARPGMGKSAVAAFFMYHHARNGEPSIYFSLEMPQLELITRLVSLRLWEQGHYLPYEDIFLSKYSDHEGEMVQKALDFISILPIYIDDTAGLSVTQIKAKIMKYRNDYKITSAYIDYIQLMAFSGGNKSDNRAQSMSQICTDLKTMAKSFDIPIILMSQVDREVGKHGKIRMPTIADLKDSGGIEEKSDMVLLLHYPDTLASDDYEVQEEDHKLLYLMVGKRKMGKTGLLKLPFDIAINSFLLPKETDPDNYMPAKTGSASSNFIIRPTGNFTDNDEPPF
jgi:replicative DNA helicase